MSRRNHDKGRLPPFVPLLKETLAAPAWKAASMGARVLYVALKARYNSNNHNNGRIYLAQRTAAEEIGAHTDRITRWFRELQHYGFIVMTDAGCLGVDGKGQAPRWRLTELGCMKEAPTRDFLRWDGAPFVASQKTEPRPRNRGRPVPETGDKEVSPKPGTPRRKSVPETGDKDTARGVPGTGDKSSQPLGRPNGRDDHPPAPALPATLERLLASVSTKH